MRVCFTQRSLPRKHLRHCKGVPWTTPQREQDDRCKDRVYTSFSQKSAMLLYISSLPAEKASDEQTGTVTFLPCGLDILLADGEHAVNQGIRRTTVDAFQVERNHAYQGEPDEADITRLPGRVV